MPDMPGEMQEKLQAKRTHRTAHDGDPFEVTAEGGAERDFDPFER
jgi:hypothetical protein